MQTISRECRGALIYLQDVCPPIPDCPKCPALNSEKCREGGLGMFDVLGRLDIRQLGNDNYSTIANRTQGISYFFF